MDFQSEVTRCPVLRIYLILFNGWAVYGSIWTWIKVVRFQKKKRPYQLKQHALNLSLTVSLQIIVIWALPLSACGSWKNNLELPVPQEELSVLPSIPSSCRNTSPGTQMLFLVWTSTSTSTEWWVNLKKKQANQRDCTLSLFGLFSCLLSSCSMHNMHESHNTLDLREWPSS